MSAGSGTERYDAFLSYRREDGTRVARRLKRRLERLRLPAELDPQGTKRIRCFVDREYRRAGPDFWSSIRDNLDQSRYLLVLVTPATLRARADGAPNWVVREIDHFLGPTDEEATRASRVCIAIGMGAFDGPLPGRLAGMNFAHADRADLTGLSPARFLRRPWPASLDEEVVTLAGRILDVPDEEMPILRGIERRRRRNRKLMQALSATLLLFVLGVSGAVAISQAYLRRVEGLNATIQRGMQLVDARPGEARIWFARAVLAARRRSWIDPVPAADDRAARRWLASWPGYEEAPFPPGMTTRVSASCRYAFLDGETHDEVWDLEDGVVAAGPTPGLAPLWFEAFHPTDDRWLFRSPGAPDVVYLVGPTGVLARQHLPAGVSANLVFLQEPGQVAFFGVDGVHALSMETGRTHELDPRRCQALTPDPTGRFLLAEEGQSARLVRPGLGDSYAFATRDYGRVPFFAWPVFERDGTRLYLPVGQTRVARVPIAELPTGPFGRDPAPFPELDHGAFINELTLGPEGDVLWTAGQDGLARAWATRAGIYRVVGGETEALSPLAVLRHGNPVMAVDVSTDHRVLTSTADGVVRLFHQQQLMRIPWQVSGSARARFLPGRPWFGVGTDHGEWRWFRTSIPRRLASVPLPQGLWEADVEPGLLAIGESEFALFAGERLWMLDSEQPSTPPRHRRLPSGSVCVDVAADGARVLVELEHGSGRLRVLDRDNHPVGAEIVIEDADAEDARLSNDGDSVVAPRYDGSIRRYVVADGSWAERSVLVSPNDDERIRVAHGGAVVALTNTNLTVLQVAGEPFEGAPIDLHRTVSDFAVTRDGGTVYTCAEQDRRSWHEIRILSASSGAPCAFPMVHEYVVSRLALSSDESLLAALDEASIVFWDARPTDQSGEELWRDAQQATGLTLSETGVVRALTELELGALSH